MEQDNMRIPSGLGFSMALNEKAMSNFSAMDKEEKCKVIEAARNVHSKKEMQELVRGIAERESIS